MISPDLPIRSDATRTTCNCFGFVLCVFPIFFLLVSYATPVQDLIGDTPSQCILEMSKVLDQPDKMEDDWRRLWSELVNRPLQEEIVSQAEEGPTRFLLKLWCRAKPPSQATVGHLIQALNSIYRNDVARNVEKYCEVGILSLVFVGGISLNLLVHWT